MGDRAYVEATLYGVAGHEQEIVNLFEDWSGGGNDEHGSASDIFDGVNIGDQERYLGTPDEIGPHLEALGVSYVIHQSGCYEFAAEVRMFAPTLGVFQSDTAGDGVVVPAGAIDDIVTRFAGLERGAMEKALALATGKEFREHFDALANLVGP
jgi:hypothetical protein